jgi:hypothetical protein
MRTSVVSGRLTELSPHWLDEEGTVQSIQDVEMNSASYP